MKTTRAIWHFMTAFMIILAPLRANADTPEFLKIQPVFEQGLRGDADAVLKAYPVLQKLVKQYPDNPLFLAYLGADETLQARDNWVPWTRIKFLDSGLDHVDKALAMITPEHDEQTERTSPISMETRLVALTTFIRVPSFSNRLQDAKDLFAESIEQDIFFKSPPEVRQRIYLQGAEIAKAEDDTANEIKYLKKALSIRPDGYYADQIRARLKELEK